MDKLIDEAIAMGAEVIEEEQIIDNPDDRFGKIKNIKQALGTEQKFHPDLTRYEFKELLNKEFIINDARIISDWDSYFGTSDFALMRIMFRNGDTYSTLGGGKAIVNQVRKLINQKKLPVMAKLSQKQSASGMYYVLE